VKVLTETAAEAGRRIGRKEAAESVAAAIAAEIEETDDLPNMYVTGMHRARWIAVNIASLASGAASDATSVPSEGPGTSEPSKAASNRCLYEDRHWSEVHECCREVSPCPVARQGLTEEPS
jgi:hypothetical protein